MKDKKFIFRNIIPIVIIVVFGVGGSIYWHDQHREKQSNLADGTTTDNVAQDINMEELFANFPPPGATEEKIKTWNTRVVNYAHASSLLDITNCNPEPPIITVEQHQKLMIKNLDIQSHDIIHGPLEKPEIIITIPPHSEKEYAMSFPDRGIFGYKCDNRRVGIFFVIS